MKIFILEDEINRHPRQEIVRALAGHTLTIATDIHKGVELYKPGTYDLLLLDHDMHGYMQEPTDPDTGYQFVKWLVNQELGIVYPKPLIVLHSQNPKGARAMLSHLLAHRFRAIEFPFGQGYVNYLKETYA